MENGEIFSTLIHIFYIWRWWIYLLVKICDPGKNVVFVRHSNKPLPLLDSEGIVVFASRLPPCFKFQVMSLYRCGRTHRAADSHRKRQRRPKTSGQRCPIVCCMYNSQIHSPWMGDIVGSGTYIAWRAGTTTLCRSQLYPRSQGLRIWLQNLPLSQWPRIC